MGIPTTERELTEEFKHKLKESLKLPDDVTDEEILGLSAISETANYSTIPPANKDDIDLESFLGNEDTTNSGDVDTNGKRGTDHLPVNGNNYFLLKLEVLILVHEVICNWHLNHSLNQKRCISRLEYQMVK